MRLLLDLGNSRIKWAGVDAGGVMADSHAVAWDKHVADVLQQAWAALPPAAGVWAASVVDAAREAAVAATVLARFGQPLHWVRTPREACGVRNA